MKHDLGKVREWSADPQIQAAEPPAGCPLAADDKTWSYQPLSASLATCHANALDHLRAVGALVEAGSWHPVATFSLTRGALVAASHAVYLSAPSAARERQARNIAYAGYLVSQRRHYNREMKAYPGVRWRQMASVAAYLAMRRLGLEVVRQRLGLTEGEVTLPRPTKVLKETAPVVLPDRELQGHALSHWMVTSSDAHALHWGAVLRVFERGHPDDPLPPPGLRRVGLTGDVRSTAIYTHMPALFLSWSVRRTRELMEVGRDPDEPTKVQTLMGNEDGRGGI